MNISWFTLNAIIFSFFVYHPQCISSSPENDVVGRWAEKLGEELWDLAETITQRTEIKSKYKEFNASIEKKNPQSLLAEIVENVTRMLKRKMDAVKCILTAAEAASEDYVFNETDSNFTYYNSKYSVVINENGGTFVPELPESLEDNFYMYDNFTLNPDTHFHQIPVNTNHSSVHVPTNVYDKSETAQTAIEWSEELDEIFRQNYNSDPALSWQFFGSSSGIMRHYPAMQWSQHIDLFDCRTRPWFIEAATCSKDVVILLDNSGSMTGNRNHTARFTVSKILDTFSNNDFINIYEYNNFVKPLEPCFNDTLVQATKENIAIFKNRMTELQPEENSNLTTALIKAFGILEKFRTVRNCGEESNHCNQAIMIVTDGVPNNSTEVFKKYNWLNNGTTIPVRIFTYLIGREVINVPATKWMTCLNRGYFAHIRSLDETTEKVLKYIPVIAQPLVLQEEDHPISWTHAYITDNSFEEKTEGFENYRLLTSVTAPAFDRKLNQQNKTAELLGVAGTDVPIDDIEKLVQSHKIGVNGYAFVVSNNGYLIMHPSLRPLYDGRLNLNYNSMDLTEVEFMDDDLGPREFNEKILELREAMVENATSSIIGLQMKNFYDDMRRPYKETYDYYFAPLDNTPFTIGIALPQSHGKTLLKINDIIGNNHHMGIDTTIYFSSGNWKVHPKWVYCKYRYLEGHEFKTPEEEVLHFLYKSSKKDLDWIDQYEETFLNETERDNFYNDEVCARKTYGNDDYYCNQDLIQRLVFDATVTHNAFHRTWKFRNDREEEIFKQYNTSLRFVATMSGLTRWKYIFEEENNTQEFGEMYPHSIDETWYKSSVLQHKVDKESFVYSVPFDSGNSENIKVTGSHAIFPRDAGLEVPGCVVGFQFQHSNLYQRFLNITSKTNCQGCIQPCTDDMLDCYIIDNNGYVVISENQNDTGRFFGEIEGAVMTSMLENKTFDSVTVYDFQAVCTRIDGENSASNILLTPFYYISYFVHWAFHRTIWTLIETHLYSLWSGNWLTAYAFDDYDDSLIISTTERTMETSKPTRKLRKGQNREEEEYFQKLAELVPEPVIIAEPCDKKATLYILNQTKFIIGEAPSGVIQSNCSRPYILKRIPHSNMMLVVVNASFPTCDIPLSSAKEDITYLNNPPPCNKLELNNLPRRKLSGCYHNHPKEHQLYELCGSTSVIKLNIYLLIVQYILRYIL